MRELTLSKNWRKGLGTELMVFCVLLDYGVKKLNISEHLNNKNFEKYKKIFNVSDEQLIINHTSNLLNEIEPSDLFKVYSPYIKLPNTKKDKKYIGIAGYQDSKIYENPGFVYPESKIYSIDEYSKIYKLIKTYGYEVITLDNKDVSLEDKVHLISEYCECVIGYEGGTAHLCHMLNIPYIMLPWRVTFDAKLLHLDEKTYFLDSLDHLLSWKKEDLDLCIKKLHNGNTNNELVLNPDLIRNRIKGHPRSIEEIKFLGQR
jgi:hypothetical protein